MEHIVFWLNPNSILEVGTYDDTGVQRFDLDQFQLLGYANSYTKILVPKNLVSLSNEGSMVSAVFGDQNGHNPTEWFLEFQLYNVIRNNLNCSYARNLSGDLVEMTEYQFFGIARHCSYTDHTGIRYYIGDLDFDSLVHRSTYNEDAYFFDEDARDRYDENNRPQPSYVSDYHSGSLQVLRFDNQTKFWVGLEIEKEDQEILESLEISEFLARCPQWKKERDGSLDCDSGYELISPMMQLNVPEIMRHVKNSGTLVRHINADYSDDCGGHINLSDESRSAWELFDDIAGYLPLLCALYPSRVHKSFCQAKPKHRMVQENEKYQAIKIHRDRVEIRIFPAVKNLNTLEFRLKLCEFMMKNPAPNPKMVKLHRMRPILSMIYPGKFSPSTGETKPQLNETKFTELKNRIQTHTQNLK